jgi:hypothetical protein
MCQAAAEPDLTADTRAVRFSYSVRASRPVGGRCPVILVDSRHRPVVRQVANDMPAIFTSGERASVHRVTRQVKPLCRTSSGTGHATSRHRDVATCETWADAFRGAFNRCTQSRRVDDLLLIRARRVRWMVTHLTVEQRQLALRLRARGLSLRQIGRQVGCTGQEVWLLARGAPGRPQPGVVAWVPGPGRLTLCEPGRRSASGCTPARRSA